MTTIRLNNNNIHESDLKIINLLLQSKSNQQIAEVLDRPLSTIQRRVKMIQQSGLVDFKPQLGYRSMGLDKGLLHVYLRDGDLYSAAEKLSKIDGVISANVHFGDSDVVLEYLYNDINDIVALTAMVKHEEGVDRVVWSHEVHTFSQAMELVQQQNGHSKDVKISTRRNRSFRRR